MLFPEHVLVLFNDGVVELAITVEFGVEVLLQGTSRHISGNLKLKPSIPRNISCTKAPQTTDTNSTEVPTAACCLERYQSLRSSPNSSTA